MLRSKIGEEEVIVLFSSAISQSFKEEKDMVYRQILSLGEQLLAFKDGTSFTVNDTDRIIVAELKKNDLPTVYIQHIIEKPFMYDASAQADQAG